VSDLGILDLDRIAHVSFAANVRTAFLRSADDAMKRPPLSVTHKSALPPGGTIHDYYSFGPYWWPDPTKPDGLPYIKRDGEVNPSVHSEATDRMRLEHLGQSTLTLALASLVDRNPAYLDRAVTLLRTWFIDPATRMNPNFEFAQAIPGKCTGRGIGIIDGFSFIPVTEAARMARRSGAISDAEHAALRTWFEQFLDWLLTHPYGLAERAEHNNHGTWYDAQLATYALFTGRHDLARSVVEQSIQLRIEKHIQPDGRQPHELARTRSFTYSCFNLDGLFTLAWVGRRVGVEVWSHPFLRPAMEFLAQYAEADRPWPYPELEPEAHLPPPKFRLFRLLRQAAVAWDDSRYDKLSNQCETIGHIARVCWP